MANATTQIIAALSASLRKNAATLTSAAHRAKRGDIRGIHRLRVATRRLREALPAGAEIAALADSAQIDAIDIDPDRLIRSLRRVTKSLGPVRELDVARTVLAEFAEREAWPAAVVARVDAYCTRLRDQALADAVDALDGFDAKETRKRLAEIADNLQDRRNPTSLTNRLREGGSALAREIGVAGTLYAPAALHEIRIAAKKLRYVLELAGEPVPGALRKLKSLQSRLGKMHDAQVLQHRMQELAATSGDRGLVASLTAMERAIEAACREWHAKVLKTLPGIAVLAQALAGRELPAGLRPRGVGRPVRMAGARPQDVTRASKRKRIA